MNYDPTIACVKSKQEYLCPLNGILSPKPPPYSNLII